MKWGVVWLVVTWTVGCAAVWYFHRHRSRQDTSPQDQRFDGLREDGAPRYLPHPVRGSREALGLAFGLVALIVVGVGVYSNRMDFGDTAPMRDPKTTYREIAGIPFEFETREEEEIGQVLEQLKNGNKSTAKVTVVARVRETGELGELEQPIAELQLFVNTSSLKQIKDLTELKTLVLDSTSIEKLDEIKNLKSLTALDLGKTPFFDTSQLRYFPKLEWLDLSETKVSDFNPLRELGQLKILDLEGTKIGDLSVLQELAYLRRLNLSRTAVSDVKPLAKLTDLEELNLSYTSVQELDPLHSLSALRKLNLGGVPVEREEIELLREKLAEQGNTFIEIET